MLFSTSFILMLTPETFFCNPLKVKKAGGKTSSRLLCIRDDEPFVARR